VQCLQNGVWNKSANLQVVDKLGLGEHWSFMTDEVPFKTENSITSITIDDVMKQYQIEEIDLLKIDIEGAEKELFFDNYENWLPKTKVLYIELHDRIRKGTATSFFKAISQYDFSIYLARETLICIRN
jgi:FkbM family methyltransferase